MLRLTKKSVIGIVALSSAVEYSKLEKGVVYLEKHSLRVEIADNVLKNWHGFAGTPEERVENFNRMVQRDDIDAIFFARGGFGVLEILERIDWKEVVRHPKLFVGYSDVTPILNFVAELGVIPAIHAPMVATELADGLTEMEEESLWSLLTGDYEQWRVPYSSSKETAFEATLKGGCLTMLKATLGSRFFPCVDNTILFIEDIYENSYQIDRILTQLLNSGNLKVVRALAVGRFEGIEYLPRWLEEKLEEIGNVIFLPIGHNRPAYSLPIGCRIVVGDSFLGINRKEV